MLTQTDRLQGLVRDFLLLARVNGGIEALAWLLRPRDVLLNLVDETRTEGVRVRFAATSTARWSAMPSWSSWPFAPGSRTAHLRLKRLGMVTVTVDAGPEGTSWEVHDGGFRLTNERISQLFRPFTRSDEPVERRGPERAHHPRPRPRLSERRGRHVDEHGTVFWVKVPAPAAEGA